MIDPTYIQAGAILFSVGMAIFSGYIGYKAYMYQRMESTIKADTMIIQNAEIIRLLKKAVGEESEKQN